MAANISACSLFSVWLLYKSIFLLAWLSSAITSKLPAEILDTHSLNTIDNVKKIIFASQNASDYLVPIFLPQLYFTIIGFILTTMGMII